MFLKIRIKNYSYRSFSVEIKARKRHKIFEDYSKIKYRVDRKRSDLHFDSIYIY